MAAAAPPVVAGRSWTSTLVPVWPTGSVDTSTVWGIFGSLLIHKVISHFEDLGHCRGGVTGDF